MRDCENCIYSGKDGCVKWECEFVSKEEARRIVAEKKELPTANLVNGDCISRKSVKETLVTKDGETVYLTDGHINCMLDYEQKKILEDIIAKNPICELKAEINGDNQ